MNISGAVDCGLYAIAVLTSLAFGQDEAMRPHSITSFETKKIVPFPVLKHRRPANKVAKVEECILHCYCRMPDEMVCCYLRDAWYHKACVKDPYCSWLCTLQQKFTCSINCCTCIVVCID